ncbi:G5 domain-containing protein [Caldibacillus thermoamylovorans]
MRAASIGKLFLVMAVCTVYFLSFVRLGVLAYESFGPGQDRYRPGTSVGPISLAGMTPAEARRAVADRVSDWRATASIPLRYQEKQAELSADLFTFRLSESIQNIVNGRSVPLLALADMSACLEVVGRLLPPAARDALDVEALEKDLEAAASQLSAPSQPLDLTRYLPASGKGKTVVSEAAVPIYDESLSRFLAPERRLVVRANQLVSLRTMIEQAGGGLSDRAVEALASAVYRAVLSTNFVLMERYAGSTLPDGIAPGFEAKVDRQRDLQWLNPNTVDYTLILRYDGRQVKALIHGWPFAYQYIVRTSQPESIAPRKIIQYDSRLAPEQSVVKQTGRSGLLVKVEREVRDGAKLVRRETVSEDFYPPAYTIEVRGLKVPESSVSAPEEEEQTPAEDRSGNQNKDEESDQEQPPSESGQRTDGGDQVDEGRSTDTKQSGESGGSR